MPFFSQVEASGIATAIRESALLTGTLSGLHLIGLTLLVGSVLVSSTRLVGMLFHDQPVGEVTRATRGGSIVGLALSVSTGLLLVAPRIATASNDRIFRIKMLTLGAAIAFHFSVYLPAARGRRSRVSPAIAGSVAFLLWCGVLLAGCAFILLE